MNRIKLLGLSILVLIILVGLVGYAIHWTSQSPIYRIASGSMAPHLLGPHYKIGCPHCRISTAVDGLTELPEELVCPNCGLASEVQTATLRPGNELQWKHTSLEDLRRYDVVVFDDPTSPGSLAVKRLAFLPGEQPTIADGDLYDGQTIIRKTTAERERMKLLVYDASHALPDSPRFASEHLLTSWQIKFGEFRYHSVPSILDLHVDRTDDWLVYHHRSCLRPASSLDRDTPPHDSYAYNHALARALNRANDCWLEWRIDKWEANALEVKVSGESTQAIMRIDFAARAVKITSGDESLSAPLAFNSLQGVTIRAGQCDQTLFLELSQGEQLQRVALETATIALSGTPFSMRIEGQTAQFSQVKVYRDIVWIGAERSLGRWAFPEKLGPDELFLLGDNVPISDDSRSEMGITSARNQLRGIALESLQAGTRGSLDRN